MVGVHLRRNAVVIAALLISLLSACSLTYQGVPTPVAQNASVDAPVIRIAAPMADAVYLEGVTVNIQALVADGETSALNSEIRMDGELLDMPDLPSPNDDGALTLNTVWMAQGAGAHQLTITAARTDGGSASETVRFYVTDNAEGILPEVTLSAETSVEETAEDEPTATRRPTERPTQLNVTQEASELPNTAATPDYNATADAIRTALYVTQQAARGTRVPLNPPTEAAPENTTPPTTAPTATLPAPTDPVPAPTINAAAPIATFVQSVNVRSGPGVEFDPPIGSFTQGATTEILGVNAQRTWYLVVYNDGEGWVFSALVTVEGDVTSLPVEEGPPPPSAYAFPEVVALFAPSSLYR